MNVLFIDHISGNDGPERANRVKARPREQLNRLLLSETFERLGNVQRFIFCVGRGKVRSP